MIMIAGPFYENVTYCRYLGNTRLISVFPGAPYIAREGMLREMPRNLRN